MKQLLGDLLLKQGEYKKMDVEDRCLHLFNSLERTVLLITVSRSVFRSQATLIEKTLFRNLGKAVCSKKFFDMGSADQLGWIVFLRL